MIPMTFRPLAKRILVQPLAPESKVGALYLPENSKEQPQQGTVIAAGQIESVKVGDTVVFARYGGAEVTLDGQKLLIIEEDNILGVVDPADPVSEHTD